MTQKELNTDIKKLAKNIFAQSQIVEKSGNNDTYFDYLETKAKPEFNRLFNADRDFTYMNRISILIMLRLNIRHRFMPLHQFGLNIDLESIV